MLLKEVRNAFPHSLDPLLPLPFRTYQAAFASMLPYAPS
jgi:hypothetical protein